MSIKIVFFHLCFSILFLSPVHAGKVQDLRNEIVKSCGADIPIDRSEMIDLVRKVYLTCTPGREVEIKGGCVIQCKRRNLGTVIGRSQS